MNFNAGAKHCKGRLFCGTARNYSQVGCCVLLHTGFRYSPTAILAEVSCCDRRIRSKRAPSSNAFQLASMMLLETPTVDQLLPLLAHCTRTRTLAAVLLRESRTRTL